jgi:hypothetical protein
MSQEKRSPESYIQSIYLFYIFVGKIYSNASKLIGIANANPILSKREIQSFTIG